MLQSFRISYPVQSLPWLTIVVICVQTQPRWLSANELRCHCPGRIRALRGYLHLHHFNLPLFISDILKGAIVGCSTFERRFLPRDEGKLPSLMSHSVEIPMRAKLAFHLTVMYIMCGILSAGSVGPFSRFRLGDEIYLVGKNHHILVIHYIHLQTW